MCEVRETQSPFPPTEGVIKVWNSRQGFIARVGHKDDLFFIAMVLPKTIYKPAVGDRVRFDVASSRSGRVYAVKDPAIRLKINVMGMWGLNFKMSSFPHRRGPFRTRQRTPFTEKWA